MSNIPDDELAAYRLAKRQSDAVAHLMEEYDPGIGCDVETLIELDLRWQAGDPDIRPTAPLLRIARAIGLERLLALHRVCSPYSATGYSLHFSRRDSAAPPRSDDRTPRRYRNEIDRARRRAASVRRHNAQRLGLRTLQLREDGLRHREALTQAAKELFPGRSKRWQDELYKEFQETARKAKFVAGFGVAGFGPVGAPVAALEHIRPPKGRPAKSK